jgi:predicted nucleotidyltransferase
MSGLLRLKIKAESEIQAEKKIALAESARMLKILSQNVKVTEAYLFGSATSGKMTKDSDLDILIVLDSIADLKAAHKIVYAEGFTKYAVDWIFKEKSDFEKRKNFGGVCFIAFHEGVRLL